MNNLLHMTCMQSNGYTSYEKLGYLGLKRSFFYHMKSQITPFQKINDNVQIFIALKSVMDICDEVFAFIVLVDHLEKFELIYNGLNRILLHDSCFQHFLHSIFDSISLDQIYFAKATATHWLHNLEIINTNRL